MSDALEQSKAVLTLSPAAIRSSFASVCADAALETMRANYLPLRIDGVKDRNGYEAVHDARMQVKAARIAVDKTRRALKEDALEYGRAVDTEAGRLRDALEPIEAHLAAEEGRIDQERARLKAEAEAARKAKLDERVAKLAAIGRHWAPSFVEAMRDADFELALREETALFKKEQAEIALALKEQREAAEAELAERKRVAQEAARRDAERRQAEEDLAAERRRLDKEREAFLASVAAEREKAEELERAAAAPPPPASLIPPLVTLEPQAVPATGHRMGWSSRRRALFDFADLVAELAIPSFAHLSDSDPTQVRHIMLAAAAEIRNLAPH